MIDRPNVEELETLLTSLDRQRFYSALSLLDVLKDIEDPDQPWPTYHVIRLGLLNWMETYGLLDPVAQIATVKAFDPAIKPFAMKYDDLEMANDKRLKRPAAGFTILDNYAAIMPQPYHSWGYYIVSTGEWTYTLPDPALTAVTCDLSVLMLGLLTRIEEIRQGKG